MREISIASSNSFPSPRPHHLFTKSGVRKGVLNLQDILKDLFAPLCPSDPKNEAVGGRESNLQGFSNVLVTDDPVITTSKPPSHFSPPPDTTLRKMKRENQSIKSAAQQGLRH